MNGLLLNVHRNDRVELVPRPGVNGGLPRRETPAGKRLRLIQRRLESERRQTLQGSRLSRPRPAPSIALLFCTNLAL